MSMKTDSKIINIEEVKDTETYWKYGEQIITRVRHYSDDQFKLSNFYKVHYNCVNEDSEHYKLDILHFEGLVKMASTKELIEFLIYDSEFNSLDPEQPYYALCFEELYRRSSL